MRQRAQKTTMTASQMRLHLRSRLESAFGARLRGLVLYGSRARGTPPPDSDVDVLVLLEGPVRLGRDVHTAVAAIYPLQLETDAPIHTVPVDAADYEAQDFALYRNARKEGIAL